MLLLKTDVCFFVFRLVFVMLFLLRFLDDVKLSVDVYSFDDIDEEPMSIRRLKSVINLNYEKKTFIGPLLKYTIYVMVC